MGEAVTEEMTEIHVKTDRMIKKGANLPLDGEMGTVPQGVMETEVDPGAEMKIRGMEAETHAVHAKTLMRMGVSGQVVADQLQVEEEEVTLILMIQTQRVETVITLTMTSQLIVMGMKTGPTGPVETTQGAEWPQSKIPGISCFSANWPMTPLCTMEQGLEMQRGAAKCMSLSENSNGKSRVQG